MPRSLPVLAVALSAFLLFSVQPLLARIILPRYGGSAAVWTTAMLFFQAFLLGGYAYAHISTTRLAPRAHALLHTAFLIAAVAVLPVGPDDAWLPSAGEHPVVSILLVLTATAGLPFFILASTTPLVQAWIAGSASERDIYVLFAVSNAASLIALVGYPYVLEPFIGIGEQVSVWSWMFGGCALLLGLMAWKARGGRVSRGVSELREPPPSRADRLLWIVLAATASALLLAVTNHITQNIAAVPLLWVVPLALYLLTFVIAFSGRSVYIPSRMWGLVLAALVAMAWYLGIDTLEMSIIFYTGLYLAGLFIVSLFCHGELYLMRPHPQHLTSYYLAIASGGALGGMSVAVLAPAVFDAYHELSILLVVLCLIAAYRFARVSWIASRLAGLLAVLVAMFGLLDGLRVRENVLISKRNFYGAIQVMDVPGRDGEPTKRRMVYGTVIHGEQMLTEGGGRIPTAYYRPSSGIGMAIAARADTLITAGVIGLGPGTLAAYGRRGDVYHYYELNHQVSEAATEWFSFLRESPARQEIIIGDGRVSLSREEPNGFDVLAVDAFSGDAVPVHLLTLEAVDMYLHHVKDEGIIAFHVTNKFVDLVPVVGAAAREKDLAACVVREDEAYRSFLSAWILVVRDRSQMPAAVLRSGRAEWLEIPSEIPAWTDDHVDLVGRLR